MRKCLLEKEDCLRREEYYILEYLTSKEKIPNYRKVNFKRKVPNYSRVKNLMSLIQNMDIFSGIYKI